MEFVWQMPAGVIPVLGYLVTLTLLPVVLLTRKPQPVSTLAWIMAIIMLPFLGAVLFLVFGINRVARRVKGKKSAAVRMRQLIPPLAEVSQLDSSELSPLQRSLHTLCVRISPNRPTWGNDVRVYNDGEKAYLAIVRAIQAARSSIHLEYYIWQPDRSGTRLRDELIRKAKEGVRVRFLYDTIGSMRLTSHFLKPMRDAGIEVHPFVPGQTIFERWSINLRNHRKIVIVDGEIGFTGGMNIGDEYLGRNKFFGYWRDTHLMILGPVVQQLQEVFTIDWKYATGDELHYPETFPQQQARGEIIAHVISGGPDEEYSRFHTLMFAAINEARGSIRLMTSYFVPTPSLVSALEAAALRGVDVKVMVSGPKTYWFTREACRSNYDSLLAAGVEVYEYTRGQLHAKTLTIDQQWTLVGTPNFDARSVFLNFEVGVAIFNSTIADEVHDHFATDIADSVRIEPREWAQRGTRRRLQESFARLFSPVL